MARRWVRYEAPVMVCVDIDDDTDHAEITRVVIGIEPDDIHLTRDHHGHVLVYDERMERLYPNVDGSDDAAATEAIRTAEDHAAWPTPDDPDWEEGPDPLRYPHLYDDPHTGDENEDNDLESLDLDEHHTNR